MGHQRTIQTVLPRSNLEFDYGSNFIGVLVVALGGDCSPKDYPIYCGRLPQAVSTSLHQAFTKVGGYRLSSLPATQFRRTRPEGRSNLITQAITRCSATMPEKLACCLRSETPKAQRTMSCSVRRSFQQGPLMLAAVPLRSRPVANNAILVACHAVPNNLVARFTMGKYLCGAAC